MAGVFQSSIISLPTSIPGIADPGSINMFTYGGNGDSSNTAVANKINYSGFLVSQGVTFTTLGFQVGTADAVNNSDVGIYNAAGTSLLANIGAQHLAAIGVQSFPILQGTVTLMPGRYIFAYTSAAGTLALLKDNRIITWTFNAAGIGTSIGGALPVSIPAPVVSFSVSGAFLMFLFS